MLNYIITIVGLGLFCACWVLLQHWIRQQDPRALGVERGCSGGCGGGGASTRICAKTGEACENKSG